MLDVVGFEYSCKSKPFNCAGQMVSKCGVRTKVTPHQVSCKLRSVPRQRNQQRRLRRLDPTLSVAHSRDDSTVGCSTLHEHLPLFPRLVPALIGSFYQLAWTWQTDTAKNVPIP